MERGRIMARRTLALGIAAALLALGGCTYLDRFENIPGTPFTPDQPEGEVTLVGTEDGDGNGVADGLHIDPVTVASAGCAPGGTVFWGNVRNTGDVTVTEVAVVIVAFDAAERSLGAFRGIVSNGEVTENPDDPDHPFVSTTLEVDQSGAFAVCAPLPFGSAARAECRTSFVIVDTVE